MTPESIPSNFFADMSFYLVNKKSDDLSNFSIKLLSNPFRSRMIRSCMMNALMYKGIIQLLYSFYGSESNPGQGG
jgi:hypothetical protein